MAGTPGSPEYAMGKYQPGPYAKLPTELEAGEPAMAGSYYPGVASAPPEYQPWKPYTCFLVTWLVFAIASLLLGPSIASILAIVASSLALCGCCCKDNYLAQANAVMGLAITVIVLGSLNLLLRIGAIIFIGEQPTSEEHIFLNKGYMVISLVNITVDTLLAIFGLVKAIAVKKSVTGG